MAATKTITATTTSAPVKSNAYQKRIENSIPAPFEESDDSEFAAGPIKVEVVKRKRKSESSRKGGKGIKKRSSETRPSKKLKLRAGSDYDAPSMSDLNDETFEKNMSRSPSPVGDKNKSPLARFFAEWDMSSASDADDEAQDDEDSDQEDVQIERESPIPKTMAILRAGQQKASSSNVQTLDKGKLRLIARLSFSLTLRLIEAQSSHTENESSHTENESEVPFGAKDDESHTESSDSEMGQFIRVIGQTVPLIQVPDLPQSFGSDKPSTNQDPRPSFQKSSSSVLVPLVLDSYSKIQVPAAINVFLRDYQRDGIKFFYTHYKENHGALLGDDMGLGKTVQVISFLSAIMSKTGFNSDEERRRNHIRLLQDGKSWKLNKTLPPANRTWPTCLIIAPTSVVYNWERELETWGYFEVGTYLGSKRKQVLHDFNLGRLDVVLTSFEIATRDIAVLDTLAWSCIFVDEVHRVKNMGSKTSAAFHTFQCQRRFGLTGTAIQNSYDELHAILHWTNPARIGGSGWWKRMISVPLKAGQSSTASDEEQARALVVADILVRDLLPEFFLRRTKDLIKHQLPTKSEQVVFCPLAPTQLAAYKRVLQCDEVLRLLQKDDPCECGSGKKMKKCCYPFSPENMLRFMAVLLSLSNHLGLILPRDSQTEEKREQSRNLVKRIFPDDNVPNQVDVEFNPDYCGKWEVLRTLLEDMRKDPTNKVLIFTKSVRLLKILDNYLNLQPYKHLCFSGETPQKERMGLIDQFHEDPDIFVFLISTMAGGTGLNLVGANKVVIFDPHWNPAHDLQAMDRAYRIGQTRPVTIYRLLGAGALEELIYACQVYKQQQMAIGYEASVQTRYFEGVKNDPSKRGELFGLKNIFKLDEKNFTKHAIEKATQLQLDWVFGHADGKPSKEEDLDGMNLAGLDNLLLDKSETPAKAKGQESTASRILDSVGVAYTHRNEEVLKQNEIEVEQAKRLLSSQRRLKSSGNHAARRSLMSASSRRGSRRQSGVDTKRKRPSAGTALDPAKPQWPPVRKHHRPKLTVEEQTEARYDALLDRGDVSCRDDIKTTFMPKFMQLDWSTQQEYFRALDRWSAQKEKEKMKASRRDHDSSSD
ncbi:hypothetical protein D9757_007567 [Collybiopsis confluens]|uniref:DNA excision repair protein ERCC-6-like 2 n=1 Tax=Collybiopsis confluens TaxID=2823264 RepID=A0A8H5HEK4_9AGAR|nr:hypothetical protein D9757_007567 [Collybiopsis confluens]